MMPAQNRRILLVIATAIATLLAGCGGKPEYTAHDIQGVMPDLAFTLTDESGKTVNADHYAGNLRLLYFGFTNCPDICPATMARLRAALGGLDADQRSKVDVLFVSVDPKRDTLKRIKRFTSSFGPRVYGLTGTQEQLRALTKRYRATYSYGEPNDSGYYVVSHSSAVYVFGPDGKAQLLANQRETVDEMTADLQKLIATTGA